MIGVGNLERDNQTYDVFLGLVAVAAFSLTLPIKRAFDG